MGDLLSGSIFLGFCKKVYQQIVATAKKSLLFGRAEKAAKESPSGAALLFGKLHPALALEHALGNSCIFSWLYHYWGDLTAGPLYDLLFLLTPFCLGMFGIMAAAGILET